MMMRTLMVALSLSVLAGCGGTMAKLNPFAAKPAAEDTGVIAPPAVSVAPIGPSSARSADQLDTTTEAEKAAALAAPAPKGAAELGRVVVALGNVTEPGFWLRSSLVSAPGKGRVETAGGASVAVDLLPGGGAAQLSLAAFRALGLGLTELPEVTVFGG